jgi:hypothetical protein
MPGRSNLGPNCVDTEQIFDGCVTWAKITPGTITGDKIASATITSDKLAAGILTQGTRVPVMYAQVTKTAGVIPIGTIPGGSMLLKCITVASTAFDGNITITIGDAGSAAGILADANIAKTLNAISGEDPSKYGAYLWVPGAQSGTTPFGVSTWATPRVKWYANDTVLNATVTQTTTTVGALEVYIFYIRGVMSG